MYTMGFCVYFSGRVPQVRADAAYRPLLLASSSTHSLSRTPSSWLQQRADSGPGTDIIIPGTQCSSVIAAAAATQTLPIRCWRITACPSPTHEWLCRFRSVPTPWLIRQTTHHQFLARVQGVSGREDGGHAGAAGGGGAAEARDAGAERKGAAAVPAEPGAVRAPFPPPADNRTRAVASARIFFAPNTVCSAHEAARLHKAPQLPPWLRSFRRRSAGYRMRQSHRMALPHARWSAAPHASSYPRSRRSPRPSEGRANACAATTTEHGNPAKPSSRRNKRERSAGEAQDQGDRRPGVCFCALPF